MESYHALVVDTVYELVYTDSPEEISLICESIMEAYAEDEDEVLGFDIETTGLDPHTSEISTVQIFCPREEQAFCFHVKDILPDSLVTLLETRQTVAHNANFELKHLLHKNIYPNNINCSMLAFKLYNKALRADGGHIKGSLEAAMRLLYNFETDKTQQVSGWGNDKLTKEQKFYAAIDAILTWLVFSKTIYLTHKQNFQPILDFYSLNKKALIPVALMSEVGVKLDVKTHLKKIKEWEQQEKEAYAEVIKVIPPEVNLRSGKQFDAWLKNTFAEVDLKDWPKSEKSGLYKKDKLTLQKFSYLEEIAVLEDYNKVQKLLSTYGKSLQNLINPVSKRVHGSYWQCHTYTGRLSSSEPNMQQQPRGDIRSIFVSELGMSLICADYSQVEVRVLAHIANEKVMLDEYRKGASADFYKLVASKLLRKSPANVAPEERQLAKAVVLGKLYGMGAEKLKNQATYQFKVEMSLEEAKEFLWVFENEFPNYKKWKKRVVREAEETLRVRAVGGCMRKLQKDKTYNISLNHPIQSLAAAINLKALTYVWQGLRHLGKENARIILSVHDEIVVECLDTLVPMCKDIVEAGMVEAFVEYFPNATTTGLVEAKVAKDWYGAK